MNWPEINTAYLQAAAETYNFRLGTPNVVAITPDHHVLFRRTGTRTFSADLFDLDARTGQITTLLTADALLAGAAEQLSDAEKARRERTRTATRGITSVQVSEDGHTLLVPLGERLFIYHRPSQTHHELGTGEGFPFDPQLAPDGQHVAFVRDGDLWIAATAKGSAKPRRITAHGKDEEFGVAEFVAQEELGRHTGFWWSPDSKQLLFQRTNAAAVDTLYVSDARHPTKAPVPFKYPRAGRPNAEVDLGLVDIASAPGKYPHPVKWIRWDRDAYPYLASVQWRKEGPATLVVLDREQTKVAVIAISDAATTKVLHQETDSAWINLVPGMPRWLPKHQGFLWMSERSGQWQLDLHAPTGEIIRRLDTPEVALRGVSGFDETTTTIYATGGADPRYSEIWALPLEGQPQRMFDERGLHQASVRHGVMVHTHTSPQGANRHDVTFAGKTHALPSVAAEPPLTATTQLEEVTIEGRTHYTAITFPRGYVPGRKLPVLLKVYGGPHANMVYGSLDAYGMDQVYADAGFIVVRADGRGTMHRGKAWEAAILRDLITVPLADQIACLRAMGAKHPEMDLDRVGVFGWSFGGYFATMAVLLHPEVFKAGIAGAPVTDWELYDSAYTERYMKLPAQNSEGYKHTSALTHAAKLTRPLLLVHGITDDNVHFAHALAFIEALYLAGKRAEVITLSATHMVPDPKLASAREQVQLDFFRTHLAK